MTCFEYFATFANVFYLRVSESQTERTMTAGDQDGAAKAGLSFGFSKKLTTKVQQTTSSSAAWKKDKDDDKNATGADLVKEVNAKGLQTTKAPEIKKAPVIPCPGNK